MQTKHLSETRQPPILTLTLYPFGTHVAEGERIRKRNQVLPLKTTSPTPTWNVGAIRQSLQSRLRNAEFTPQPKAMNIAPQESSRSM
jgi:hypothetical protein